MNKPKVKAFLILIVSFLGVISSINAQDYEPKDNSIYVSLGTLIFTNQCSFSYERTVSKEGKRRVRIKANYGIYGDNGLDLDSGEKIYKNHKSLSGVYLYGILEVDLGIALTQYTLASGFNPDPNIDYSKVINGKQFYGCAGLRFENESLLFRIGVGNLELLYAGIGFNF